MAAESILTYKKPGFPKTTNSEKSYQTTIEYVGPLSTLAAAEPAANTVWGDYDGLVSGSNLSPIDGTDQAELTVTTEYNYDGASGDAGTSREVAYEVEWVMFQRSMLEHPEFRPGGGGAYMLTDRDVIDIEYWKNDDDPGRRELFLYRNPSNDVTETLSDNATNFCKGLNMGIENYEDYSPIVRRTTTYVAGLPGDSDAGEKDEPPNFSGIPTGYEWRKSADRAVRAGGQTRWEKVEEWTGAKKVLVDNKHIYFIE